MAESASKTSELPKAAKLFGAARLLRRRARHMLLASGLLTLAVLLGVLGGHFQLTKSDWAAWVQAVGSIGAVLAAVLLVQYQHQKELTRAAEERRHTRQDRLNALRSIFMAVGQTAQQASASIDKEHTTWELQAQLLDDAVQLIKTVSPLDLPDHALILRFAELTQSLRTSKKVLLAMESPRSPEIKDMIAGIIGRSHRVCLNGITDVTTLLKECSTPAELEQAWRSFERQEQNARLAEKVWLELQKQDSDLMAAVPLPAR
jgi:hypothetical protein